MIKVTLSLYSGIPDPEWFLSDAEENELIERLEAQPETAIPLSVYTRDRQTSYGGYVVEFFSDKDNKKNTRFAALGLHKSFRIGGQPTNNKDDDKWLLNTSDKRASTINAQSYARTDAALRESSSDSSQPDAPLSRIQTTPTYCSSAAYTSDTDFSDWNNSPDVATWNCYNYASNNRTRDDINARRAQPGCYYSKNHLHRNPDGSLSQDRPFFDFPNGLYYSIWSSDPNNYYSIVAEAIRDGWVLNGCFYRPIRPPFIYQKTLVTALLLGYDNAGLLDYHWLRLCQNGHWCQKHGGQPVTNLDDNNNLITDPSVAFIRNYPTFCGIFGCPVNVGIGVGGLTTISYVDRDHAANPQMRLP